MPQEVAIAVTIDVSASADKQAAMDFVRGVLKDAGAEFPRRTCSRRSTASSRWTSRKTFCPSSTAEAGSRF